MRALVLERPGVVRLDEVAIPALHEGDLLVRVVAATTCGTDLKAYRRGHPQIPMPGLLGHEYSGIVEATGPRAKFKPGDEVMGVHSAPCQACRWCIRGQENLCQSIMETKVLGAFAPYLRVPARVANLNVYLKPADLEFAEASLLEPYACVMQGLMEASPRPDDRVLVIGPGAIGLMFVAALQADGIRGVTLAGRNPDRLRIGASFGASTVGLGQVALRSFDLVIECTGQPQIWEQSISFVDRGGTLVLFGGCPSGSTVTFDPGKVHYDQIRILSPFHFGTAAVRFAYDQVAAKRVKFGALLSGERTLEEAADVFADLEAGRGVKYVFRP